MTYEPASPKDVRDALEEAIASWSPDCSRLCLEGPYPDTAPPPAPTEPLQRIHVERREFAPRNVGPAEGGVFDRCGVFHSGTIAIDADEPVDSASMVRAFGITLGLDPWVDSGTSSVLPRDSTRTAPSAADLAALCAMYGTRGWCDGR